MFIKILFIGTLCATNCAFAAMQEKPATQWEIGTELYKETYQEYVFNHPYMQEDAHLFGLYGKMHYAIDDVQSLQLLGRAAFGISRYKGAVQGEEFGSIIATGQHRYLVEMRGLYGFTLPTPLALTPLIGAGYRQLTDRLDQTGFGGYRRTSQYVYLSTGVEAHIPLNDTWSNTSSVMYQHLLSGRQTSGSANNKLIHHQHKGYGIEVASTFSRKIALGQKNAIGITPYYRYWSIADSSITMKNHTPTMEPHNTTQEVGVRVSYQF